MFNLIIFVSAFYFLLLSVIGYGAIFQKLTFSRLNESDDITLYLGFYGILLISFISFISSFFLAHDFKHNLLVHFFGISFFIFVKFKEKKKYIKHIFFLSLILFLAVLISKTHDDFPYYHLPFTKYLTEHKVIFGMGNIHHGYNLLSSTFFLNSTFYLPFINFFSFHFSAIYFLIFFNYFLLKEILLKKNYDPAFYLYLFSFVYFNLSFNRLAEFGTDKSGQLLIVVLIIKLLHLINFDFDKKKISNILLLIPLFALCISLKTYFLPYILFGLFLCFYNFNILYTFKNILISRSFLFSIFFLIFYFSHHFVSTGCLISPISFTCFESFDWAREKDQIFKLSLWLEQWSKAGAGPGYRVDNPNEYIVRLNWFNNWIDKYFFTKFLDQFVLLLFSFTVIFFIFKSKNFTKITNKSIFKRILPFYVLILIIFFIWFLKHPTLRYGGYSIYFLTLAIPFSYIFLMFENKANFKKKSILLIVIVFFVFNLKNVNRIYKEINRTDKYAYKDFPFFFVEDKKFDKKVFNNDFNIYSTIHHCWASPTPCGSVNNKIFVNKRNGYFFINKLK